MIPQLVMTDGVSGGTRTFSSGNRLRLIDLNKGDYCYAESVLLNLKYIFAFQWRFICSFCPTGRTIIHKGRKRKDISNGIL